MYESTLRSINKLCNHNDPLYLDGSIRGQWWFYSNSKFKTLTRYPVIFGEAFIGGDQNYRNYQYGQKGKIGLPLFPTPFHPQSSHNEYPQELIAHKDQLTHLTSAFYSCKLHPEREHLVSERIWLQSHVDRSHLNAFLKLGLHELRF